MRARVRALAVSLRGLQQATRRVDYPEVERLCGTLAARLRDHYGPDELPHVRFAAIPRGGTVVLGLLSYLLDLRPEQLAPGPGPLCLVDDCALTGLRFHGALASTEARDVVFAHLYSHPELRRAIRQREPRVRACVAAADLAETAVDAESAARREARLGPGRYWYGSPEVVAFPWSEPDRTLWNPVTGRVEHGWLVLPPHRCLKTWVELGLPPEGWGRGAWRVAEGVVTGLFEETLWLCRPETGALFALEGVGFDGWRALVGGPAGAAVPWMASLYEEDAARIAADLERLAAQLAAQGLIVPAEG